jgi:hypothetical protein
MKRPPQAEGTPKSPPATGVPKAKGVNKGRHESSCRVCKHPRRGEIERQWLDWGNTTRIAKEFRLSRDSIYRHAHALGLFAKRQRNVRKALEHLIEQAEMVKVNAQAVVSAVSAYVRINSAGQWVERTESVNLNQLFERMTRQELETYAREGVLPDWFTSALGATAMDGQEDGDGE